MIIRDATDTDAPLLVEVFTSAVRTAGPDRYSPEQIEAWTAAAADPAAFGRRILSARTLVAEVEERIVGFVSVTPDGYIPMLFVHGHSQGRGVGTRLLDEAVEVAIAAGAQRVHAEASAFSLAVFLRAGFVEVREESVVVRGVPFDRWLVERSLIAQHPASGVG